MRNLQVGRLAASSVTLRTATPPPPPPLPAVDKSPAGSVHSFGSFTSTNEEESIVRVPKRQREID